MSGLGWPTDMGIIQTVSYDEEHSMNTQTFFQIGTLSGDTKGPGRELEGPGIVGAPDL